MDSNCRIDGIYAGRYVLIEYDAALSNSNYDKGWYLVTSTDGHHYPCGDIESCVADTNQHLYFNGIAGEAYVSEYVKTENPLKLIYIDKYKHFTILNDRPIYIKLKRNGTYVTITYDQFIANYPNYTGTEYSISQSSIEDLDLEGIVHAHIANNSAHIEDTSKFKDANTEVFAVVLPGAQYSYNLDSEFWTIQDTTFITDGHTYSVLNQIPNDASSNYLANFNIDQSQYNTARGYDSTVWQKVYQNGDEKYVMIAELNTVIPTFGVTSDPPSLLPISPHFGADSTNAYYDLHWQPNWGFRIKAANNQMMMPKVMPNGQLNLTNPNNIQSQYASIFARDRAVDNVYYPSDQQVKWAQTFEDHTLNSDGNRKTLYFNPVTQHWETDAGKSVQSAIYFNRNGFNSSKINYSKDLISEESKNSFPAWNRYNSTIANSGWTNEDNIMLTPTGLSGNVYNLHDGSVDLKAQADTQELSIMLPSIGDTIAEIWDLVYGGRNTNAVIKATNFRNKDIAWEDAKGEPARRGLRLTGIEGDEYNKAEVDTLAGAINTAHDLLGMIISTNTEEELQDVNNLDENRIYYNSNRHQYFRKHKTYDYTEISSDMFKYNEQTSSNLNQEKIDTGLYYEYDEQSQTYVVATVYNPNKQYFLKEAKPQYEEIVISGKILTNFPYQNYKWYQDYLSENSSIVSGIENAELQKLRSDYILDTEYKGDRTYFDVTATEVTLKTDYKPGLYWYKEGTSFLIDFSESKTPDRVYYTLNSNQLLSLKNLQYLGIYIPGYYYFKKKGPTYDTNPNDFTYELDLTDFQTCNGLLAQGQVVLESGSQPNLPIFNYYILDVIRSYDITGSEVLYRRTYSYTQVPSDNLNADTYVKGIYYIKVNGEYQLGPDTYQSNLTYYLQQVQYTKIEDTTQVEINVSKIFTNQDLAVYKTGIYFTKRTNASGELIGFDEVVRAKFLQDPESYSDEFWVFAQSTTQGENPPFLSLDAVLRKSTEPDCIIQKQDAFYNKDTFHYMKNGSYILDTAESITEGRQYYQLSVEQAPDNLIYYEPGKYYVESPTEDSFELAIDSVIDTDNVTLYSKQEYYVIKDEKNILPYGTKWNHNAAAVPDTLTLATRKDKWELIPIQDFSTKMGTLNGMILKMYQMLEPYDTLTRDDNKVSGVINKLKDLIARFEVMKSQEILVVDDYGRAQSAPIATSQYNSYNQVKVTSGDMINSITKDKFPTANSVGAMERRWITVNVDGNPERPLITIHHNFQPVTNTNSWLNKNGDLIEENDASSIATDKIQLYTPKVDDMGHVVGNNIETVTLPYGFKTFVISNEDTDNAGAAVTIGSNGSIIADNTQDTLTFKTVNKWLRFTTDVDNDTFTIAHKLHSLTPAQSEARVTNKNTDEVESNSDADKITLHDIVWDDAAHMLEDHPHTYTLPYGFKFIATDVASEAVTDLNHAAVTIAAESTQDTVTFKSANIWTKLSANSNDDSVTFGHLVRDIVVSDIANTNLNIDNSTVNNVLAEAEDLTDKHHINIQDITHDEAGHIRSRQTHTYTLPFGYKFITTNGSVGDTATDIISNTNIAKAINTQDSFSIDVGNTWLKTAVDTENRKITLYHYVKNDIDYTASTATDFNNISSGEFTLKDISHDEAGHIIAYKNHLYTLPYSFKTFTHSNTLNGVNDLDFQNYVEASHNITATNVIDSIEFASKNKWIRLQANNKTLTLSHLVTNVESDNDTESLITTEGGKTFTVVQSLAIDEAGHITAFKNRTYTVPNSFYKIAITNSNNVEQITSNTSIIEADCTNDTLNIAAGDRWILLNNNSDTDTLTIGHALPKSNGAVSYAVQPNNQNTSMLYGEVFTVPTFAIDEMGHIATASTTTLTLPKISLSTTDTGNVLTGIGLTSTTGAFTYNKANVGTLALTEYSYNSNGQSASEILATDSINTAFAKLTKQIENEVTATIGARDVAIAAAINSLDSSLTNNNVDKTLTGITITDGKITASTFDSIQIIADQVTVNNTNNFDARYYTETEIDNKITALITKFGDNNLSAGNTITGLTYNNNVYTYTVSPIAITANQVTVNDNTNFDARYYTETEINDKITALAYTASNLGQGKTITALTETNGVINITTDDISIVSSQITDLNSTINTAINTLDVSNTVGSNEVHLLTSLSEANGKISYTSVKLDYNNHILPLLPTGNNAFLTKGDAENIYQPKGNYAIEDDNDLYVKTSTLSNNVTTDTTFLFKEEEESSPEERKTIDELIVYIKGLEERIYQLENTSPDPGE